jgi:protocatechuate 3,4-dioxygenase beta subunit
MNRVLAIGLGLLLLFGAAFAVWQLTSAGATPAPSPSSPRGAAAEAVPADAAAGTVPGASAGGDASAPVLDAAAGREAVPESALVDDKSPAIVGRVVGPGGAPVAGATVYAVPGMGFANANGQLDLDTFDAADFEELDSFDPRSTMRTVRAQLQQRAEARTGEDGSFRIRAPGESRGVGLRVLARGHAILDRRVDRPTQADVDAGTLALQRGAIVAGRVLDPSGAAIAGAAVSRVHEMEARMMGGDFEMPGMGEVEVLRGGEAATTDAAGRFELAHLAPGQVVLRARHDEHPTARSDELVVAAGAEVRDVLVTMRRGGEIRGVVTGLPEQAGDLKVVAMKKPRADVGPTGMAAMFGGDLGDLFAELGMPLGERSAAIDGDGRFALRGLAAETYRIWVARDAVGFAGSGACSARVEAQPGGTVELRYDPGATVTMTVVDATSGAPVERLWVRDRLRGGGGGFADLMASVPQPRQRGHYPGGAVTVANLRPKAKQTLSLEIEATGYRTFERSGITLPANGSLDLGTVKLERAPVLEVTVTDARTGAGVANATVRLARRDGDEMPGPMGPLVAAAAGGPRQGRTDANGRCTLNRYTDEHGVLTVAAKDYAPFTSERLAFAVEGPDAFTASLHAGGAVTVRVTDGKGAAVDGARVEHRPPAGAGTPRKTDGSGAVRFERLAPGGHRFRIGSGTDVMAAMMVQVRVHGGDDEGDGGGWQAIDVADGAELELELTKAPTASLRGVVRENGAPLDGARVSFREGLEDDEEAQAQAMVADMMSAVGGAASARNGKTDESGAYSLAELPEGRHRLQITHKSRAMPALVELTLQNGDNVFDVELDMTTVRGAVHDPDGKPVDGARVRVRVAPTAEGAEDVPEAVEGALEGMLPGMNLGGRTIRTDESGVFELRGVDPDVELLVQATAKGFAAASVRVTAPRGTTTTAPAVKLGAAGRIKVSVATEEPFAAAVARWVGDGDAPPPVFQMLRRGKGTLDGLRPGPWEVGIQGAGGGGERPAQRVEVKAGETVELNL